LDPEYEGFIYNHPATNKSKSFLSVDYKAHSEYEDGSTICFLLYKAALVGIYILGVYWEVRTLVKDITWVCNFAGESDVSRAVEKEVDCDEHRVTAIYGVSKCHRCAVLIITLFRLAILVVLTVVGLFFLLTETDVTELLLNAVALVFVVQIAQLLYQQVLGSYFRDQHEAMRPMECPMLGSDFINQRPAYKDVAGFVAVLLVLVVVMVGYHITILEPTFKAVTCTCLSMGENCQEASQFAPSFWDTYWAVDVPKVFKDLDKLKKQSLLELNGKETVDKLKTNSLLLLDGKETVDEVKTNSLLLWTLKAERISNESGLTDLHTVPSRSHHATQKPRRHAKRKGWLHHRIAAYGRVGAISRDRF